MKKFYLLALAFLFISCTVDNTKNITVTNNTSDSVEFSVLVNNTDSTSYTIASGENLSITVNGGYKLTNLSYKYRWDTEGSNQWLINDAITTTYTVINNLSVAVELLDNNVSEFSCSVSANNSAEAELYNTSHDFILDNTSYSNSLPYVESGDNTYFYTITENSNSIIISLLS